MQRQSNKQSRGANSKEIKFLAWCKQQPSIVSGTYGVEVHHCVGSSAKTYVGAERVHIGHWYCIPLTPEEHKMFHSRKREFEDSYGYQSDLWLKLIRNYDDEIPLNIIQGICNYGR